MRDMCPLPLLFLAVLEARKYRWDKSIAEHRDVGDKAITEWFKKNWKTWHNTHWVEHIQGKQFYNGFSESEFNVASTLEEDQVLVNTILDFIKCKGNISENLGVIMWTNQFGKDINKVMKILRRIDVNSKRYVWDEETMQILCMALIEADKYKWIESQKAHRDLGEAAIHEWFFKYWNEWLSEHSRNVE